MDEAGRLLAEYRTKEDEIEGLEIKVSLLKREIYQKEEELAKVGERYNLAANKSCDCNLMGITCDGHSKP